MPVNPNSRVMKAVKNRSLGIMLALSVVYALIFLSLSYWQTNTAVQDEMSSMRAEAGRIFELEKSHIISFFRTRVKCHMASKQAAAALESQDRDLIYELAKPKYDILTQVNPFVTNMQFYAPDGTSLRRIHQKEAFGDRIADQRPMVRYAIENQVHVSGFEEGRFGLLYGVIEPVFNQRQEYVGSVEFGLQPEYFEQAVKGLFPDVKVLLVIPKKHFQMSQVPERFVAFNDSYLTGQDAADLRPYLETIFKEDSDEKIQIEGRAYLPIRDIYLNDFQGRPFMQLLVLKDVEATDEQFQDAIWQAAFLGGLLLLLMWLGGHYGLNYFVRNVSRLNRALASSHAKLDAIFNTSQEGIAILDLSGRFVTVNPACTRQLGYSGDQLKKRSVEELMALEEIDTFRALLNTSRQKTVEHAEQLFFTGSGQVVLLQLSLKLMPDGKHILMALRDVTQVRRQQKELERYTKALDEHVVASKTDMEGVITYASQAFCEISGYSREELLGQKHSIVRHPDMPKSVYRDLWQTIASGKVWKGELKNRAKNGQSYWVEATVGPEFNEVGGIVGYTAIRHDISDKKRVEELSITDELTGLYNRRYYNKIFDQELKRRQRYDQPFLFVIMDVDYFKRYNDTYGHRAGDEALEALADKLKECFRRSDDYLFRLGGEEFGAILGVESKEAAEAALKRIESGVEDLQIPHSGNQPYGLLTLSIGACLLTHYQDALSEDEIYKQADRALYKAKKQGRNRSIMIGRF